MAAASASCLFLSCNLMTVSLHSGSSSVNARVAPLRSFQTSKPLSFSSNLSHTAFPQGGRRLLNAIEKPMPPRRSVVCEAAPAKKADSAEKRARQAEKRRIYNKSRKSEIKTRMKKVILISPQHVLQKKSDAQAEEIFPVEKLIAEAYSAIDKAVKVGTLHRNTGARRKSRLARRKKTVEVQRGWYTPPAAAAVTTA